MSSNLKEITHCPETFWLEIIPNNVNDLQGWTEWGCFHYVVTKPCENSIGRVVQCTYCPSKSFFPLNYPLPRVEKTWNLDRSRTAQLDGAIKSCVNPIHPPQYSALRTLQSPLEPPSSLQCSKQTPVLPSTSLINLVPPEAPIHSYTCESPPKSILESSVPNTLPVS